jgi:hypothetical protein
VVTLYSYDVYDVYDVRVVKLKDDEAGDVDTHSSAED